MSIMVTRRTRPQTTAQQALLAVNVAGAAASLGFAVRGLLRPSYVRPTEAGSPLASFWSASSAVRTCALTVPLIRSVLLRDRVAPEVLAVAGLVQVGDSALGAWQRKPAMALAPLAMGLVHLASARRLSLHVLSSPTSAAVAGHRPGPRRWAREAAPRR